MKKKLNTLITRFLLGFLVFTCGCDYYESDDCQFSQLKAPIIVLAAIPETQSNYGRITLIDSKGEVVTFYSNGGLGGTLLNSYHKGDTVEH